MVILFHDKCLPLFLHHRSDDTLLLPSLFQQVLLLQEIYLWTNGNLFITIAIIIQFCLMINTFEEMVLIIIKGYGNHHHDRECYFLRNMNELLLLSLPLQQKSSWTTSGTCLSILYTLLFITLQTDSQPDKHNERAASRRSIHIIPQDKLRNLVLPWETKIPLRMSRMTEQVSNIIIIIIIRCRIHPNRELSSLVLSSSQEKKEISSLLPSMTSTLFSTSRWWWWQETKSHFLHQGTHSDTSVRCLGTSSFYPYLSLDQNHKKEILVFFSCSLFAFSWNPNDILLPSLSSVFSSQSCLFFFFTVFTWLIYCFGYSFFHAIFSLYLFSKHEWLWFGRDVIVLTTVNTFAVSPFCCLIPFHPWHDLTRILSHKLKTNLKLDDDFAAFYFSFSYFYFSATKKKLRNETEFSLRFSTSCWFFFIYLRNIRSDCPSTFLITFCLWLHWS